MQVFYFSRSGNCKRIANSIAESHGVVAHEIDDGQNWGGKIAFVKGGAMAAKREALSVTHEAVAQQGEVVLVFPIWAGTFPPAVRGFLNNVDAARVTALAVSAATQLSEGERKLFAAFYETKGKEPKAPPELLA